jgi:CheY-like chemotaxis protein
MTKKPATVLCVEVEDSSLKLRKKVLEAAGYTVILAPDVPTALVRLKENGIDAVLLNYDMPGVKLDEIVAESRSRKLPLLLYGTDAFPPKNLRDKSAHWLQRIEGPAAMLDALKKLLAEKNSAATEFMDAFGRLQSPTPAYA